MPQLFVKRLTVIDFSYLDSALGLVGESWQVDITLHGSLDKQGMVLDFGDVKKTIKQLIDEHFDHKLLIPADYPGLGQQTNKQQLILNFALENGQSIQHSSPADAVAFIPGTIITTDNVTQAIISTLNPLLPNNVDKVELVLSAEQHNDAFYHYSHGLKQHLGNCQRIAHGHRSRIQIERNGQRDTTLEQTWAKHWQDIYIGTREDLAETKDNEYWFSYQSQQGQFTLKLPQQTCYLIDTESTVENIAQHIADALQKQYPQDSFRVFAFEGIDKGAIGKSSP
jgi:6-pyruvoyl-tetrahydropterin synthase